MDEQCRGINAPATVPIGSVPSSTSRGTRQRPLGQFKSPQVPLLLQPLPPTAGTVELPLDVTADVGVDLEMVTYKSSGVLVANLTGVGKTEAGKTGETQNNGTAGWYHVYWDASQNKALYQKAQLTNKEDFKVFTINIKAAAAGHTDENGKTWDTVAIAEELNGKHAYVRVNRKAEAYIASLDVGSDPVDGNVYYPADSTTAYTSAQMEAWTGGKVPTGAREKRISRAMFFAAASASAVKPTDSAGADVTSGMTYFSVTEDVTLGSLAGAGTNVYVGVYVDGENSGADATASIVGDFEISVGPKAS